MKYYSAVPTTNPEMGYGAFGPFTSNIQTVSTGPTYTAAKLSDIGMKSISPTVLSEGAKAAQVGMKSISPTFTVQAAQQAQASSAKSWQTSAPMNWMMGSTATTRDLAYNTEGSTERSAGSDANKNANEAAENDNDKTMKTVLYVGAAAALVGIAFLMYRKSR